LFSPHSKPKSTAHCASCERLITASTRGPNDTPSSRHWHVHQIWVGMGYLSSNFYGIPTIFFT
jgi:hypothetical protein